MATEIIISQLARDSVGRSARVVVDRYRLKASLYTDRNRSSRRFHLKPPQENDDRDRGEFHPAHIYLDRHLKYPFLNCSCLFINVLLCVITRAASSRESFWESASLRSNACCGVRAVEMSFCARRKLKLLWRTLRRWVTIQWRFESTISLNGKLCAITSTFAWKMSIVRKIVELSWRSIVMQHIFPTFLRR